MALNVRLLKKVRDAIAATRKTTRVRKFDMSYWAKRYNGDMVGIDTVGQMLDADRLATKGHCRTSCCIAGHAVVAATPAAREKCGVQNYTYISIAAERLLGIDGVDADYLFHGRWSKGRMASHGTTVREAIDYLDECIAAKAIVRR